jgi:hypothetical protein
MVKFGINQFTDVLSLCVFCSYYKTSTKLYFGCSRNDSMFYLELYAYFFILSYSLTISILECYECVYSCVVFYL